MDWDIDSFPVQGVIQAVFVISNLDQVEMEVGGTY